jgi:hypothetical protein
MTLDIVTREGLRASGRDGDYEGDRDGETARAIATAKGRSLAFFYRWSRVGPSLRERQ